MGKKILGTLVAVMIAAVCSTASGQAKNDEMAITNEQVTAIVDQTVADIAKDAAGTIAKINKGEAPYKNKDNEALYVFVYDKDVNIVAHPKADMVGKNFKGKPDVKGKNFRDELVATAAKGSGWVDYVYQKPGETGMHDKTTFAKGAKGSDGKDYAVCAGKYLKK